MTLFIPAVWYRGLAIIERRWGWSPVEEEVLLLLRDRPGTSASVSAALGIPRQVAEAAIVRLMRFGLIEVRVSPEPALAMTAAAHAHLMAGRPLPERTTQREMAISLVLDKLGGSIFRRRNVRIKNLKHVPRGSILIDFPDEEMETDTSMEQRVRGFLAPFLRPGEVFTMVRPNLSMIERFVIEIDLARAHEGIFPEDSSELLRDGIRHFVDAGVIPVAPTVRASPPGFLANEIDTTLEAEQLIFGGPDHLARFEAVVAEARSDVFVLSTFVAAQNDPKSKAAQERVCSALEGAVIRGVNVHLFFGSSMDEDGDHLQAMAELQQRLRLAGANIAAHPSPVHSHAKLLIADDGAGGARAIVGSCNWLKSPFRAHELSAELRDDATVSHCLELFEAITAAVPTARGSRDAMQAIRAELRNRRSPSFIVTKTDTGTPVRVKILDANEHLPLLRRAAHEARQRMILMTHRMGAPMVQNVMDITQVAAERIATVQALYSLPSGPVKKRDVRNAANELAPDVDIRHVQSKDAMLHCKALLWDEDDIVVTSFNWGSQTASEDKPLDEIGLHLNGKGIANILQGILTARVSAVARNETDSKC